MEHGTPDGALTACPMKRWHDAGRKQDRSGHRDRNLNGGQGTWNHRRGGSRRRRVPGGHGRAVAGGQRDAGRPDRCAGRAGCTGSTREAHAAARQLTKLRTTRSRYVPVCTRLKLNRPAEGRGRSRLDGGPLKSTRRPKGLTLCEQAPAPMEGTPRPGVTISQAPAGVCAGRAQTGGQGGEPARARLSLLDGKAHGRQPSTSVSSQ